MMEDFPVPPDLFEAAAKAADLPLRKIIIEEHAFGTSFQVHCQYESDMFHFVMTNRLKFPTEEDFVGLASTTIVRHVYPHCGKPLQDLVQSTYSCNDPTHYARLFTVTFITPTLGFLSTILERVARQKCDFEFQEALERTLKNE